MGGNMRLRNKKTGEIGEAHWVTFRAEGTDLCVSLHESGTYEEVHSLAELNEEWEDYEPKEPLIKDEKIRKAIKYIFPECALIHIKKQGGSRIFEFGGTRLEIYAPDENAITHGCSYLVTELCGEEEE